MIPLPTPSRPSLIETISGKQLGPDLQIWLGRFNELRSATPGLFAHRTTFLWKWLRAALELTTLGIVTDRRQATLALKSQFLLLSIIMDDVCDVARDEPLFERCARATEGHRSHDDAIERIVVDLAAAVRHGMRRAPNWAQLEGTVHQAWTDWLHGFRDSLELARSGRGTHNAWTLHMESVPHTTGVLMSAVIDLLFAAEPVNPESIQNAGAVFRRTQQMAQIGNWLTTWRREIMSGDLSSGVVTLSLVGNAAAEHALVAETAENSARVALIAETGVERQLLELWGVLRDQAQALADAARGMDLRDYVDRFTMLLAMQYACVGRT